MEMRMNLGGNRSILIINYHGGISSTNCMIQNWNQNLNNFINFIMKIY